MEQGCGVNLRVGRALSAWLPVIVAVAVIATESTDTFSATRTSHTMRPWFEGIFGHVSDEVWWWMHHLFRKSGHFIGYGIVGLTFFRAWRMMTDVWRQSYLLGVVCTFLIACGDEWHQTFVPSRTGSFVDVLLDTVGAAVLCGVGWIVARRWRRV